jgi:hypothetical protein
MKKTELPHTHLDPKYRFLERHKTLTARPDEGILRRFLVPREGESSMPFSKILIGF